MTLPSAKAVVKGKATQTSFIVNVSFAFAVSAYPTEAKKSLNGETGKTPPSGKKYNHVMDTPDPNAERMARFLAGDKTANGAFLAGVLTTGIYCLPACPARKPLPGNVVFVDTPAEAKARGLRACKRCRPDEFYAGRHPDRQRLTALAEAVRRNPGAWAHASDIAAASPWGTTKCAALFRAHYGLTPAAFLTQARVQAATRLLRLPRQPVLEAGFAVGFDSASAFYRCFRQAVGCAPGEYRKRG